MGDVSNVIEVFNNYVRSELMVLVIVLYFVIKMLKNSKMKEQRISLTVYIISVVLCGVYTFAMTCTWTLHSILLDLFSSVTQGALIAGGALYGDVLLCSGKTKPKLTENTQDNQDEQK